MKLIQFTGFKDHPKPDFYNGPSGEWKKGAIKSVKAEEAERLLKDFPDAFSEAPKGSKPTAE